MGFDTIARTLAETPNTWLVTGVAGFIGSHILECLLELDQRVVGLDDFSTGSQQNLEAVCSAVGAERAARFTMKVGDIRSLETCRDAVDGVDRVIHQAAIGSVPKSVEDPLTTHAVNVTGFVHVLTAARDAGVPRVVYASSSAVYGDSPHQPNREDVVGRQLSPYASSKLADELYAQSFAEVYDIEAVGLRYFNVFGPRQDPNGAYAAVIPRWIDTLLAGESCSIYGDGETTRDFCYVRNVAEANVIAAMHPGAQQGKAVYNVAGGSATSLNALYDLIRTRLADRGLVPGDLEPRYEAFRPGDIRHSVADTARAEALGMGATLSVADGLDRAVDWYIASAKRG